MMFCPVTSKNTRRSKISLCGSKPLIRSSKYDFSVGIVLARCRPRFYEVFYRAMSLVEITQRWKKAIALLCRGMNRALCSSLDTRFISIKYWMSCSLWRRFWATRNLVWRSNSRRHMPTLARRPQYGMRQQHSVLKIDMSVKQQYLTLNSQRSSSDSLNLARGESLKFCRSASVLYLSMDVAFSPQSFLSIDLSDTNLQYPEITNEAPAMIEAIRV